MVRPASRLSEPRLTSVLIDQLVEDADTLRTLSDYFDENPEASTIMAAKLAELNTLVAEALEANEEEDDDDEEEDDED